MKEKLCGIYLIKNIINNKIYIGKSVNIKNRWKSHRYKLNNFKHINIYLQREWIKYGKNNFIFEIIEICDVLCLSEREIFYISLYNSANNILGYNLTSGGEKFLFNEEIKVKMRNNKNIKKNPVLQFDMNGNLLNSWESIYEIERILGINTKNIREACKRKHKKKTSFNNIWIYKSEYEKNGLDLNYFIIRKSNAKPVCQFDLNNNFIAEYKSAREANKITGISYKNISRCCTGERNNTCGYIWKFKDEQL